MKSNQHTSDDWRVPPQLIAAFALLGLPILLMYVLGGVMLAKSSGDTSLLHLAVALGVVGVGLLFLARLPLYRSRRFFTFGPHLLTGGYRRLYYLAYMIIVPSVVLLLLLFRVLR